MIAFKRLEDGLQERHLPSVKSILVSLSIRIAHQVTSPWATKLAYLGCGAALLMLIQVFSVESTRLSALWSARCSTPKGLLDFKLQSEQAFDRLPLRLNCITKRITYSGSTVKELGEAVSTRSAASTQTHISLVRRFARKLNKNSRQLDADMARYESEVAKLEEGLTGWLTLMKVKGHNEALSIMLDNIAGLRTASAASIESFLALGESLLAGKGLSSELNLAIDLQYSSVKKLISLSNRVVSLCDNLSSLQS